MLESTRKKEAEVQKETAEQLESFRKQREDADRAALDGDTDGRPKESPTADKGEKQDETWAVSKKRKREKDKESEGSKGLKLRHSSSTREGGPLSSSSKVVSPTPTTNTGASGNSHLPSLTSKALAVEANQPNCEVQSGEKEPTASMGLVGYSSDEDE